MPKTEYLSHNLLNHVLRGTSWASPAQVYIALFTVAPTVAGGGTEVVGGGYVRRLVTFLVPSGRQVVTGADVLFPIATADYGTVVAYGVMDALSGGNMLYFSTLGSPREIKAPDQYRLPMGQIVVSEL